MANFDSIYVKTGLWKCQDSPSGAHHWVEMKSGTGRYRCKWCGATRYFPRTYSEALGLTNPKKFLEFIMTGEERLTKHEKVKSNKVRPSVWPLSTIGRQKSSD